MPYEVQFKQRAFDFYRKRLVLKNVKDEMKVRDDCSELAGP